MNNIYSPLTEVRKNLRINWYRCPIDPKTFRELMQPSDFQGFIQAGGHLFIFLITGGLTLYFCGREIMARIFGIPFPSWYISFIFQRYRRARIGTWNRFQNQGAKQNILAHIQHHQLS